MSSDPNSTGGPFGYDPRSFVDRERAVIGAVRPADGDAFDPADHNVEDVLKYVAAHPDEAQAVLDAEWAGKARKGVTEALGEEE